MFAAIDLFCGAGGLTHGLLRAGLPVLAGIDNDPTCAYAYKENNTPAQFIERDITEITSDDLEEIFGNVKHRVLVGCAPCQPFSLHTQKYKKKIKNPPKWGLLREFLRLVRDIRPDIVSMENVPRLVKKDVFQEFEAGLKNLGYRVSHKSVYAPDYGVPQARYRLILLASRLGPIELIPPTHDLNAPITVLDAIGKLPKIAAGKIHKHDPLHRALNMSPINMARIKQSKPGGTWEDWDDELLLPCHQRASGKSYKSVYGRMKWDRPAPTLTTQFFNFGTGRFGHPKQDRALTLREGAVLQTFPLEYIFVEPNQEIFFKQIGMLIGNAVPVELGRVIGESIKTHLDQYVNR